MAKLTIPAIELLRSGHSACPGCAPALAMRLLLKALGPRTVVAVPACCWTVIATPYPTTALGVPLLDNAIEATGASVSGIRAACDALGLEDVTVVGFAGDGGTADIGLQSLSGMLERRTDAIYVMYDNEAYMNTGVQRSGATPAGAWTTTTPVGGSSHGKPEPKKDVIAIVLAHRPAYAATINPSFPEDLVAKATKARAASGARFLHAFTPCPPGWRYPSEETIEIGRLATDTGLFPLYEVEAGRYRITRRLGRLKPIREYLELQGRFAHLPDAAIDAMQASVRSRWETLLALEAHPPLAEA
ncbi:MAG TPA: thiamine pyrophosphate-dependent enzyme [Thermoplasmata archaeon]|nr:thiamine pyrophosphate-dependent enzyme [Thermoplasmata archaeon]